MLLYEVSVEMWLRIVNPLNTSLRDDRAIVRSHNRSILLVLSRFLWHSDGHCHNKKLCLYGQE